MDDSSARVLSGLPFEELASLISPVPNFRAVQIFKWIAGGISGFEQMSNLPQTLRQELAQRFILRPRLSYEKHHGDDDTIKIAIKFAGGAQVESVLLSDGSPGAERHTACLSSQAGCPCACVFCKTGLGFSRNLYSEEIVEQFLLLREAAGSISNIVVMGMGEPLLNLTELRRALSVITSKQGMNFSGRRITVSTCGIAQGIKDIADNGPSVRLALSLTTADEALRRRLMPISAAQPLCKVKEALSHFQERGGGRITLEAVLLGGINTRNEDAAAMAEFAKNLDAVINIIPWNPVAGLEFDGKALRTPTASETEKFIRRLQDLGLNVTRRYRRGRSVTGSCGQLGNN
jgi:23S rRNA (adenine2503-C2)-methyltransferase